MASNPGIDAVRADIRDYSSRHPGRDFDLDAVWTYVDVLDTDAGTPDVGMSETIRMALDRSGAVRIATSRKIGNLRLKLGEVCTRGVAEAGLLGGHVAMSSPAAIIALHAIKFLHYAYGLLSTPVQPSDADILLRIYAFEKEEGRVDTDVFLRAMAGRYDAAMLEESLDRLEKLGCITRGGGALILNEDIVISQAA